MADPVQGSHFVKGNRPREEKGPSREFVAELDVESTSPNLESLERCPSLFWRLTLEQQLARGRHNGHRHKCSLTGNISYVSGTVLYPSHLISSSRQAFPHSWLLFLCAYFITTASAFQASRFGRSESHHWPYCRCLLPAQLFPHRGPVQALTITCLDCCTSHPTSLHQPI